MELLKFELQKIWARKSIYLALAIFLAVFLIDARLSIKSWGFDWREAREPYRGWEGPITAGKYEAAEEERKKLGQPAFMDSEGLLQYYLLGDVTFSWNTYKFLTELRNYLAEQIAESETAGVLDYSYRENLLHYEMLGRIGKPVLHYRYGWIRIITYFGNFGAVFMGGLLLLALAPVFAREYTTQMDSLILSSRHGKKKIITAKVAASFLTIVGLALFFAAVNVGTNACLYSLDGSGSLIQYTFPAFIDYSQSPFNLEMSTYFILQLVTHIAAAVAFGLLVLLLSVFSRNSLSAFFAGGLVLGIPILLSNPRLEIETPWLQRLLEFGYARFLQVEYLYNRFWSFNILGRPLLYPHLMFLIMALLSAAALWGIYRGFRTRQVC